MSSQLKMIAAFSWEEVEVCCPPMQDVEKFAFSISELYSYTFKVQNPPVHQIVQSSIAATTCCSLLNI